MHLKYIQFTCSNYRISCISSFLLNFEFYNFILKLDNQNAQYYGIFKHFYRPISLIEKDIFINFLYCTKSC